MSTRETIEVLVTDLLRGQRMTTKELAAAAGFNQKTMSQWLTKFVKDGIVLKVDQVRFDPETGPTQHIPRYTLNPSYDTPDDTTITRVKVGPGRTRVVFGDRWRPGGDRMKSASRAGIASSFEKI